MRRVTEVIDCWYDSGAMPFAQWGWPHTDDDRFRDQFPADFISEALDQTRGWFYSQLAISTMLFGEGASIQRRARLRASASSRSPVKAYPHPFRNCIVLGLMLGEDGNKMSKSLRNYREPTEIFDKYGADALRWFFFAGQPPWTAIRYREQVDQRIDSRVSAAALECLQLLHDLRRNRRVRPDDRRRCRRSADARQVSPRRRPIATPRSAAKSIVGSCRS